MLKSRCGRQASLTERCPLRLGDLKRRGSKAKQNSNITSCRLRFGTLFEQIHLSGVDNVAGDHPGSVGGIFELGSKPELSRTTGARAPGHGHTLGGVVAGMAGE